MQAENFAASVALPTFIAILKCALPPGPLNALPPDPDPRCVVEVVVEPVVVEEAMLATPGEGPPPSQPAASSASAPAEAATVRMDGRRRMMFGSFSEASMSTTD
jgi:hypothetical protein